VLLAADCCYTKRNLDRMILQKAVVDREAALRTMAFLLDQRKVGTHIIFGHDGRQWAGVEEGVPIG
jgi:N-acyl homoserine lactone hydrolase